MTCFNEASKKGADISEEEMEELEGLLGDIRTLQSMPSYLTLGINLSFLGYVASALLAVAWILNFENYQSAYDAWLPFVFVSSTIIFFITGFWIIREMNSTMKKEFDELKKKAEETKSKP